jgi:3-methyladenine DNA glycosylase/8-oxoguanine DNA glycosylase
VGDVVETPDVATPDEIARVAERDVRHMLSRSGLREIVELARAVAEERGPRRPRPPASR